MTIPPRKTHWMRFRTVYVLCRMRRIALRQTAISCFRSRYSVGALLPTSGRYGTIRQWLLCGVVQEELTARSSITSLPATSKCPFKMSTLRFDSAPELWLACTLSTIGRTREESSSSVTICGMGPDKSGLSVERRCVRSARIFRHAVVRIWWSGVAMMGKIRPAG